MEFSLQIFVIIFCAFVKISTSREKQEEVLRGVKQNQDGTGSIKFTPPKLDDEDSFSLHMPDDLKCDACRIVAYRMRKKLNDMHKKLKSTPILHEADIIDILDDVCNGEFPGLGIKEVDGIKRLSGPGSDVKDVPGVMQGGGRWPLRLQEMCSNIVGELGEDVIYKEYRENKKKAKFSELICNGTGVRNSCNLNNKQSKEDVQRQEL